MLVHIKCIYHTLASSKRNVFHAIQMTLHFIDTLNSVNLNSTLIMLYIASTVNDACASMSHMVIAILLYCTICLGNTLYHIL